MMYSYRLCVSVDLSLVSYFPSFHSQLNVNVKSASIRYRYVSILP